MRRLALSIALLSVVLPGAALADAVTTRIETRPYYGAIVTIEQGVRVWRALPPHDRIIIVPEGVGKVNVNIDSSRPVAAPPAVNNVTVNQVAGGYDVGGVGYGRGPRYRHNGQVQRYGSFPAGPGGHGHKGGHRGH